jgi:CBS domain-containing protein
VREILNVAVGDLMSKPAVTVNPETSIEALTEVMNAFSYNAFPVVDGADVLHGLVTRLDLFKLYLLPYHRFIPALEDTWVGSVAAIMSRGVISLFPHEPAIKAIFLMVEHRIRTIPIVTETVAGPVVVGVVTRRDLGAALKP